MKRLIVLLSLAMATTAQATTYRESFRFGGYADTGSCETIYNSVAVDEAQDRCISRGFNLLGGYHLHSCTNMQFLFYTWVSVKVTYSCEN